jgi:hypothetical protein
VREIRRKTRLLIRGDEILRITGRGPDGWITEPYLPEGLRQVNGNPLAGLKNAPNVSEIEIIVDE